MGLGATSEQLDKKHPYWRNQSTSKGGHNTQVRITLETYKNIGRWILQNNPQASILDASSGLGHGTDYLRDELGLKCVDVEPFASKTRANPPDYTDYNSIRQKFDIIISNAVVNVIPDDWRETLILQMGKLLKKGGMLIINTRSYNEIAKTKGVTLDDDGEKLVPKGKSNYAYQRGFSTSGFVEYVKDVLGPDYKVGKANTSNCGISNSATAVVCYKI